MAVTEQMQLLDLSLYRTHFAITQHPGVPDCCPASRGLLLPSPAALALALALIAIRLPRGQVPGELEFLRANAFSKRSVSKNQNTLAKLIKLVSRSA